MMENAWPLPGSSIPFRSAIYASMSRRRFRCAWCRRPMRGLGPAEPLGEVSQSARARRRPAESDRVEHVEGIIGAGAGDQRDLAIEVDGQFDHAARATKRLVGESSTFRDKRRPTLTI